MKIPVGHIQAFEKGSYPGSGWLECDGAAVPRAAFEELAKLIEPKGGNYFKLPDLRGSGLRYLIKYKEDEETMSALDRQEGGGHYKDMPIQPVEFITKNKLGFLEGCVIKRMCRWQSKDGLKDLRKAIHEIELLIEQTEEAEKREHMEREAEAALTRRQERAAVQRGHPMIGDRMTPEAVGALKRAFGSKGDPAGGPFDNPLRACTCEHRPKAGFADCRCPPEVRPDCPCNAQNRAPTADSRVPGYCLPEGALLPPPGVLADGTRVLVWRPRNPGDPGTRLFGWVEIGFMWDDELVRYDAEG